MLVVSPFTLTISETRHTCYPCFRPAIFRASIATKPLGIAGGEPRRIPLRIVLWVTGWKPRWITSGIALSTLAIAARRFRLFVSWGVGRFRLVCWLISWLICLLISWTRRG